MNLSEKAIWFLDSWIWWLTVLEETIKLLGNENYIFLWDNLNNPYWDKSEEEVLSLSKKWVDFLIEKWCKIIVITCNTITNVAIKKLRTEYDIPIIWTEPAIKTASESNKNILVMATTSTINSKKFNDNLKLYQDKNIKVQACSGLANLIENNKTLEIDNYLKNIFAKYNNIDIIVLWCTHYSHIKNNIRKILPQVELIDWNIAISKQIKKVLNERNLLNNSVNKWTILKFFTKDYE